MTTVGYGDIVPKTVLGKVIASITMIFGIGFISMLTSTLTTHFKSKKTTKKDSNSSVENIELLHQKIDLLTKTVANLEKKIDNNNNE